MAECKYVDCPSVDLVKSFKIVEEKLSNLKALEVDICYIRKMVDKNEGRTEHDLEALKQEIISLRAMDESIKAQQSEFLTKKDIKVGIAVVAVITAIVTEAIHLLLRFV